MLKNVGGGGGQHGTYYTQGCGVGVGVTRSRGNEPAVGVGGGVDHTALTPTPECGLEFVASLGYVIENLLPSWNSIW